MSFRLSKPFKCYSGVESHFNSTPLKNYLSPIILLICWFFYLTSNTSPPTVDFIRPSPPLSSPFISTFINWSQRLTITHLYLSHKHLSIFLAPWQALGWLGFPFPTVVRKTRQDQNISSPPLCLHQDLCHCVGAGLPDEFWMILEWIILVDFGR